MWAALKADMSEFVSTVKAETTDKLNAMDQGLDDVNDIHNDASGAMIDLGTGMVIDDEAALEELQAEAALPTKEEMLQYLFSCEAVFADPLSEEEETSMESFVLDEKTQEISKLLEDNPETLQATFAQLTSEVEYADFWKRYYCRLADDKIEETYANYYVEPEPGPSTLSSVTNFLGGAVARLVDDEGKDGGDEAVAPSPFFNRTGEASAKSALDFLTGGGRPPFVLNTAVSDDDYEDEQEAQKAESSDDEEDFGWGEDSDDEDDEEDDGGGSEVVMEFKDAEKESLKEQLQQAMEEKDQLQNTIEMQAAEIKQLKVKGAEGGDQSGDSAPAAAVAAPADEAIEKELEDLKMQMFEKDAELAGLKLKMEDNKMEAQHQQEEISEQIQVHLQEKDDKIASLEAQLKAIQDNATNADDALLTQRAQENQRLQTALAHTKKQLQEQEAKASESTQVLEKSQSENQQLNDEVKSLKDQLAALQKNLDDAAANASNDDDLRGELVKAKQKVTNLQQEAASAKSQAEGLLKEKEQLSNDLSGSQSKVAVLTKNLEQAKSLLQQAAGSAAQVDTITKEKEALAVKLETEKAKHSSLQEELATTKAQLQQTQAELETKTHASAGSQSTGIKVDSSEPTSSLAEALAPTVDDDDGDDWGDDW